MFTFDDWNLSYDGQVLAMQHDNKSRQILVQGTFPAGYTWAMEVQVGTAWDAIVLSPVSGGLAALLTQDNLAYAGWYEMQLRGAQGDVVRRTNIIRVHVPRSLSGTGQWPTVPSEFIQIEQRIADLNAHPSIPGENGYWLVWDPESQQYKESPYPLPNVSVGPPGQAATVKVSETITSDPGSNAMVENLGTENTALLRFTIPRGQAGPAGATPQLAVTVTTLPPGQQATAQIFGPAETPTITIGIPQGLTGDRGPQGVQGIQGWSVSAAELDSDGALVLTIRNPADGQTQTLPPVAIDNSAALQAVEAAITAQGTTQVQRVEEAGDDAVGAVSTAKDAALKAVGQAQTTATGAVSSAQTTAVRAVQDAQGTATTAISQAQAAAVGAVDTAKTDALEAIEAKSAEEREKLNAIVPAPTLEDAGKTLMVNSAGTGLEYRAASGRAGGDILLAEYEHQGNQEIYFSSFDWGTATGETTEPHGLTDAKGIMFVTNDWYKPSTRKIALGSIPIEWVQYVGSIYALPVDATHIKIVGSDKNSPIIVNPENLPSNTNIDYTKFHLEICAAWEINNFPVNPTKLRIEIAGFIKGYNYRYLYTGFTLDNGNTNAVYTRGALHAPPVQVGNNKAYHGLYTLQSISAEIISGKFIKYILENLYCGRRGKYANQIDSSPEVRQTYFENIASSSWLFFNSIYMTEQYEVFSNHSTIKVYAEAVKQDV